MSARNLSGLSGALRALLLEFERRLSAVERRRPIGTGGGSGDCDCEDGQSIAVYEQVTEPVDVNPGTIWIVP